MAAEDTLQKGDAIFVFAGSLIERPLEAAELYRSGYAPRIVLTRERGELAEARLRQQGVRLPSRYDLARDVFRQVGIPDDVVITPTFVHDNTGEEARTLRELAVQQHWRRVIVVSSKYHLRRVRLACRRSLRGTGVDVIVHGARSDQATPDRWWERRSDIRALASEVPKFVAYALGAGM
jgi:uncharacterized SAM-binding protein YcdF (DUF218 family)